MIKLKFKNILVFMFFTITWLLPSINKNSLSIELAVYILAFFTCICFLYVIKNRIAGILISLIISVSILIYNKNYFFYGFSELFIIMAHKDFTLLQSQKCKKNNNNYNMYYNCISISLIFGLAKLMYCIIYIADMPNKLDFSRLRYEIYIVIIFLFFMILLIKSIYILSDKERVCKNNRYIKYNKLYLLYITVAICYLGTVLYYYAVIDSQPISRAIFFPWFIFICVLIYEKDPILGTVFQQAGEIVTKFLKKIG